MAGNKLEHCRWEFPKNLVVLNLAGNGIKEVEIRGLSSLKFLNLSNNLITDIIEVPNLDELFIGYNMLKSA